MSFFNPRHTWQASIYSWHGLRQAIKSQQAIRHILLILAVFLALLIYFRSAPFIIMFLAWLLVLVIEMINSAIEYICNLVSPEYNILIKHAKDSASAATAIAVAGNVILWLWFALTWLVP